MEIGKADMRYWYDFEFVERGPDYPVQPLSLGMVDESGREYYRQYIDNLYAGLSHSWVRENVLPKFQHMKLVGDKLTVCGSGKHDDERCVAEGWKGEECPWLTSGESALDLSLFLGTGKNDKPEFWGYYADYDHVCYAQLFGTMVSLPKGFPMWTRDIKQLAWMLGDPKLPEQGKSEHNALDDARWNKLAWQFLKTQALALTDEEASAVFEKMFL